MASSSRVSIQREDEIHHALGITPLESNIYLPPPQAELAPDIHTVFSVHKYCMKRPAQDG